MDHGSDEINVLLPAGLGVLVLLVVSLGSLSVSYLLQYRVVGFKVSSVATNLLKGFGFFGVGLVLVLALTIIVLNAYAPY